jgi:hypothetical protein
MTSQKFRTKGTPVVTLVMSLAIATVLLLRWWYNGELPRWFDISLVGGIAAYAVTRIAIPRSNASSNRIPDYLFAFGSTLVLAGMLRNLFIP